MFLRTREAERQIALADIVLLNKTDLVTGSQLVEVQDLIRAVNPNTEIHVCSFGQIATSLLLNRNMYDVARWDRALTTDTRQSASHSGDISTITIGGAETDRIFPLGELQAWLQQFVAVHWENLFRLKGILKVTHPDSPVSAFVFHGVHEELHGDVVPLTKDAGLALVIIGKKLDSHAIIESFLSTFQHIPVHNAGNVEHTRGSTQRRRRKSNN
jgi:G3E family GTPase